MSRAEGQVQPYARYALAVMVGINFLNYMDRYIPVAAGPRIKAEFGLNDTQVGVLATAFLLTYAVFALPFGIWADRGFRRNVVGVAVSVWSVATLFTGFAVNFVQLLATRSVVGLGEAGYYPAGTSLMSDYFPKQTRARAMSIWNAGTALGIAAGFAGGGVIAAVYGWRVAFFATAIPGGLFAVLAFRMREPLRGAAEAGGPQLERVREASLRKFAALLRIPTLRNTVLSQTFLFFVLVGNIAWLPFFLDRQYGLKTEVSGPLAGGVLVFGGLIGTLAGGWLGDHLSKRDPGGNLKVGIAGFMGGAVFIVIAILAPNIVVFTFAFLCGVICLQLYTGPFTAVGQNVVVPSLRAGSVTLTLFTAHLLGDSWAPLAVGWLSDRFGLEHSLLVVSPTLLLVAAGLAALALRTVADDTRAAEEAWANTAAPAA